MTPTKAKARVKVGTGAPPRGFENYFNFYQYCHEQGSNPQGAVNVQLLQLFLMNSNTFHVLIAKANAALPA